MTKSCLSKSSTLGLRIDKYSSISGELDGRTVLVQGLLVVLRAVDRQYAPSSAWRGFKTRGIHCLE